MQTTLPPANFSCTLLQRIIKLKRVLLGLFFNGGNDEACLGLLAVHNFYSPFLFFLRKTALRQVVHRDVTSPHFVRSSHLPKSAELAKAILTTINSAIKKEPIKGSFNGGNDASYIEPFINTLKEQLMSKSSTKLIYMLNQWATRFVS